MRVRLRVCVRASFVPPDLILAIIDQLALETIRCHQVLFVEIPLCRQTTFPATALVARFIPVVYQKEALGTYEGRHKCITDGSSFMLVRRNAHWVVFCKNKLRPQ